MIANPTRRAFLSVAKVAADLVADPVVAALWEDPSALAELTVGALAAHLARGASTVEQYLDGPGGTVEAEPLSAPRYFAAMALSPEVGSELNQAVRQRASDAALAGQAQVAAQLAQCWSRLTELLSVEPPGRVLSVIGGLAITLDEYLVTRTVELVTHIDDLAASIDVPTPTLPEAALVTAVDCMVEIARLRHGDLAVVRALARRERDPLAALRVF